MGDVQLEGTGQGLLNFLEWAERKGVMKKPTARAYRSAADKILSINDEDIDVRSMDINDQLERFERIHGDEYKPDSLTTYRARFKSAVELYTSYLEDRAGFKAPTRQRRKKSATQGGNGTRSNIENGQGDKPDHSQPPPSGDQLYFQFPLRGGDTAQLYLPRTLTSEDVDRLTTLLRSLIIEPPAQLTSGHVEQGTQ